ncbi:DHH phosphoesterase [Tricharina praecox]|uniref:DHH phosphoesterase n=1 Tax=Tricharina praecox TaxID=43433 RepID=UPI00221EAD03|nr:DHH phosphoesterase [Tricharina praecox]KAI5848399.1 DHH phosphoesterase [Tricharina praecox]
MITIFPGCSVQSFRARVVTKVCMASSSAVLGKRARSVSTDAAAYDEAAASESESEPFVWPAPLARLEAARNFIRECAASPKNILLVPDRDADGLSSGTIMSLALQLLSKPQHQIHTHFVLAGRNIFSTEERELMTGLCREQEISHMIVLDQGSRAAPPLVEADTGTKVLIIDHHQSAHFPSGAVVVNACAHAPVATSSVLTYAICEPLHAAVEEKAAWLAVLGVFGDLGPSTKLEPPYPPALAAAKKKYRATHISSLTALMNAPRRTPECNTIDAWMLLQHAPDDENPPTPKRILDGEVDKVGIEQLRDASARIKAETERCRRNAPVFSADRRVAVVLMHSAYQIHGPIATMWAGFLKGSRLEVVMAANTGYVEGKVNFSCRMARSAKPPDGESGVDIIAMLSEYAAKDQWLLENVGTEFANGHKQATGGSLRKDVWEMFVEKGLELTKKEDKKTRKSKKEPAEKKQKNTLDAWVKKD